MTITENKELEADNKEGMIQAIRQNDTALADFILHSDDINEDVLKFLVENNSSYSSDISELISNHAKLEWYVLYYSCKTKGSHVTREVLNAFKEGLPCNYVSNYINETSDAYEMEQRRLSYKAKENPQKENSTPAQEQEGQEQTKKVNKGIYTEEQNTKVDSEAQASSNEAKKIKTIEGELISNFIACVMSVDTSKKYDDDILNKEIQEKVTKLVNINKERNEENLNLKKSIKMYQTHCENYEAKVKQLKGEIDKLTIDNAQKDAIIQELTDQNNKFNQKLGEIMDIQQLKIHEEQG